MPLNAKITWEQVAEAAAKLRGSYSYLDLPPGTVFVWGGVRFRIAPTMPLNATQKPYKRFLARIRGFLRLVYKASKRGLGGV